MVEKNKLYFGDNLKTLREYVSDASGDHPLVPSLLRRGSRGGRWQWSKEADAVYREIVESGPRKLADLMQALLAFLGRNDMMAYLVMMAIRLARDTGPLYAMCPRGS